MVREITGVRIEHKSSNAKVMPKVSTDIDREVNPKSPEENNEVKDFEVKECTSEVPRAENSSEKQDVLAIKSTNFEDERPDVKSAKAEDQKSSPLAKPSPAVVNTKVKNNTPQKPSHLTVDKQVCETPPIAVETPASPNGSSRKSPSSSKKSLPSTPPMARNNLDDEDNWSMTSSTAASARTTRSSRTTVGVAPTFTTEERLQKRKEYYAKLEEKRKALEAEKREYEARTKEEEEAAIRKLRKNMTFKANPVPNFYYDKPPPKKELKKLPTTRAVSPKFGRRKSYSDAVISSRAEEKVSASASPSARPSRHSLGSHSHRVLSSTPTSTPKRKDQLIGSSSKLRDRSRQSKDQTAITKTPPKISEQLPNSDIAVHS